MQRNQSNYYRLFIAGLFLSLASCTGSFDPLLPLTGTEGGTVLGVKETNPAVGTGVQDCLGLGEPADAVYQEMFEALNAYRIENGLTPLIYSQKLAEVADAHLYDTWNRNYFAHVNPEGQGPSDRALAAGFCHHYVGENLAAGQRSVELVMKAWKDSPSHNDNMLRDGYVYVGMGYFQDPMGRQYWAQLFAYDVQ